MQRPVPNLGFHVVSRFRSSQDSAAPPFANFGIERTLEPISKLPEQDNEASELNESEEVLGVVFPTDEETALPLDPGEEALDEPAPRVTAEPSSILRERLSAIGAMRCNHLDALSSQLLVQRVAVVGAVTDQILRLGFDHVEVEA